MPSARRSEPRPTGGGAARSCRPLLAPALAAASLLAVAPARAGWPMDRHDAQRTGAATGTSDLKKPVAYWRSYLGGQLQPTQMIAADVNGDGKVEIVHVRSGRIVAKLPSDELVWQTPPRGFTALVGIDDLDGDGRPDVVGVSNDHAYVLSGATGAIEWAEPDGEMGTLGSARLADLDGDGRPDLVIEECGCCGVNSGKTGFAYRFGGGFASAALLWTLPSVSCGSYDSLSIVDVNGDGHPAVLNGSYTTLALLDGKTGALLAETAPITTWVALSLCRAVNVDGLPGDEALCVLDASVPPGVGQRKVYLVKYTATPAPALSVVWSVDLAPDTGGAIAVVDPVVDLDGDGALEVVASAKDAAGAWTTFVLDAATGAQLGSLPGERVAGTAAIDGTAPGRPLLFTTGGNDLHAFAFARSPAPVVAPLFTLPGRRLFVEPDLALLRTGMLHQRVVGVRLGAGGVLAMPTRTLDAAPDLTAYAAPGGVAQAVASTVLPAGVDPAGAWVVPPLSGSAPELAVARSDGYLVAFDASLLPLNAAAGRPGMTIRGYYAAGGWADLQRSPVVASLDGTKVERVLVADSRGALLRLDADQASLVAPPARAWERTHTTAPTVAAGLAGGAPGIACLAQQEPLAVPPRSLVRALRADGTAVWSTPIETNPFADLIPGRFDGDAIPDLAVQWGDPADTLLHTRAIAGATGATLWDATPVDPGYGRQVAGASVFDWDGDGLDDVFFQGGATRVLSGKGGAEIGSGGVNAPYFLPTIFDVDHDGQVEVTLHGGQVPARTLRHDLTTAVWTGMQDDKPYPYGAIASCPGAPVLVEGSLQFPSRLKLTTMAGPGAGAFTAVVLAGGKLFPDEATAMAQGALLGQLTSATVHSNLTGAGHPSALVGSSDGHLYAVDPCAHTLDFAVDLGDAVGEAVFGDTDGDGRDEILVTAADGFLYDLKNEAIAAPGFVWDIDLAHGIQTDVDVIETVDTLYCRWGAVAGATGYQVAIVKDGGGFATSPSWIDVSAVTTEATLPGLALTSGGRYFCAARALGATGPSVDAESNGVVVHAPGAPDAGPDAAGAGGAGGAGGGAGGRGGGARSAGGAPGVDAPLVGRACVCGVAASRGAGGGSALGAIAAGLTALCARRRRARSPGGRRA